MFKILVFEQIIVNKEDKNIKKYNLLSTDDYLKGKKTIIEENINTFEVTDKFLANVNISYVNFTLKELNCNLDGLNTQKFNGFFECVVICVTPTGTYKNMYVLKRNKLGMYLYKKVQSNCLVTEKGVIL